MVNILNQLKGRPFGETTSPFPELVNILYNPDANILNIVIRAYRTVDLYLRTNSYTCHLASARFIQEGILQHKKVIW